MKNKKNFFIISLSAIFAVVLCIAIIFSIRPTYASTVTITSSDGTSVYITGEGVSWDEDNNKYVVENGKPIQVHIINEYRIFSSAVVNGKTYNTSLISIPGNEITGDFSIEVSARAATTADEGRYFSKPFIIADDEQLIALEKILDGRYSNDDFKLFGFDPSDDDFSADTTIAALQKGYYVLSENILLDANEFYGIGSKPNNEYDKVHLPFQGCFDFMGYHITLNVLNQYTAYTSSSTDLDPTALFSGLFGYVNGNGSDASIIRDADVNGKIAFVGNYGASVYHYVGGIAGHIDSNTTLTDAKSEVSITTETNSPLFVGGLFGSLATSLEERFKFTYACHYGVLQATSSGAGTNISIGSLAGLIRDTHVYHFEDKSVATHIVANNLGSGSHNSGTAVVGGVAGTVYANTSNVYLKNIVANNGEDRSIIASVDSSEVTGQNVPVKYAIAAGGYGIFDSNTAEGKLIYTDLLNISTDSSLEIKASSISANSVASIYSGGFVGKLQTYGHELIGTNATEDILFKGNVTIEALQQGQGPAYAGGMFGYGALLVPNTTESLDTVSNVSLNDSNSSIYINAEQGQDSSLNYYYGYKIQYDVNAGYFSGRSQFKYALNNFKFSVYGGELQAHRAIGSTAVGDVCAGGFIGKADSDRSEDGYFTNIYVNLYNSSVNALSLSYLSDYGDIGNNSLAGGFIGSVYKYGAPDITFNKTYAYLAQFGADSTGGLKNIYVNSINDGYNSPQFTVRCIQNAISGNADYKTEGYAGGVIGLFDGSYAENINFDGVLQKSLIYFYGTNNPNTAAAGGLIGNTRNYNQYGINGGTVNNAYVICKGYSDTQKNNDGALTYDLYAGGAFGIIASAELYEVQDSGRTSIVDNIHVSNTFVHSVGENKMSGFSGGIAGGIWWQSGNILSNSSFRDGNVTATSITSSAYAGGIIGYTNRGHLYKCSAINSYVNAESENANAAAAGVCAFRQMKGEYIVNNYSQCYISATGTSYLVPGSSKYYYTRTSGIVNFCSSISDPEKIFDNYFDLASFDNDYLGEPANLASVFICARLDTTANGGRATDDTLNSSNYYIILNETGSTYSRNRYSSLSLTTGQTKTLYADINTKGIVNSLTGDERFYLQFTGDTDDCLSITKTGDVISGSTANTTTITAKNGNGLVVSNVWFNIKGKTRDDVTNESLLTAENGWYRFCSYAIKINEGRPIADTDQMSISLVDNETNSDINFGYKLDANNNHVLNDGILYNSTDNYYFYYDNEGNVVRLVRDDVWYVDENNNGIYDEDVDVTQYLDNNKQVFDVSDQTNVAGYYSNENFAYSDSQKYNVQYVLINMDQSGFYENDSSHVATDIKINALLTNTADGMGWYKNFPKYSFYDSKIANLGTSQFSLEDTKWTVPYGTDYSTRIKAILNPSNRTQAYSSNFNGRLSIERDIDNYSLVITSDSYLSERTIITVEFENKKTGGVPHIVILEFVPNVVSGLRIEPGEDTPPLNVENTNDVDGDGKNDIVYTFIGGDTARFDAFEDKRYSQLSFLASVTYSTTYTDAEGATVVNANGTVNVPDSSSTLIDVKCELISGAAETTVYIKVLSEITYSFTSIGADYNSDREAVQSTPFNFSFYSSPGYGLGPERVVITTYDSSSTDSSTELRTYDLVSGGLGFSTTTSFEDNVFTYKVDESESHDFLVSFNHLTGLYEVVVPSTIMTSSVASIKITIEFPVVYSIVFDTGLTGVDVSERYIVYQVKQGTLLDNFFYEQVYSEVFNAIKDTRYGFTLHDYYLTDDASTLPRYGETFVTMTTPLLDGETGLYYFLLDPDAEDEEVNREYVVKKSTTGIWYKDLDKDGELDGTEEDDSNKFNRWRTVTGPYTFYARWTYDIAIEIPDGVTISSPLAYEKLIPIEDNDPDKINGKQNIVPINTNNGFPFTISTDSSFEVTPRFKVYQVALGSGNWYIDADENGIYEKQYDTVIYTGNVNLINTVSDSNGNVLYYYYVKDGNQVRLVPDDYIYTDLTKYVTSYGSNSNTYIIPQYDALGKSLINGVIFLKVFNEVVDYEVSDIGEFGSVSTNNSIYEDGIFTVTYNVNYSSVVIDDTVYNNGIPVAYTAAGHNTSFRFDGSVTHWYKDTNSNNTYDSATDTLVDELHSEDVKEKIVDSVFQYYYYINDADEEVRVVPQTYDLMFPSGTSFRLYRKINGVAYDAGVFVSNSELTQVSLSNFTNIETNGAMSINSSMLIKSEQYNLVVTLPKQHSGFVTDFVNSKVVIVTDFTENYKRFAYTLTFGYDGEGNLVPIQPRSYFVLQSTTRHESFREKAFDIFNIYSYNPASGLVTRLDAPTEQASGFTLQFTPSSGKQPNIFDHRHGSSYYLWEVEKTYSTDETGASVIRQYTAKDASGNDVSVVSETQHHYYYLATNGNLNLLNVPSGCKIRLLEVDSLANPAAGVVIDTYPAN